MACHVEGQAGRPHSPTQPSTLWVAQPAVLCAADERPALTPPTPHCSQPFPSTQEDLMLSWGCVCRGPPRKLSRGPLLRHLQLFSAGQVKVSRTRRRALLHSAISAVFEPRWLPLACHTRLPFPCHCRWEAVSTTGAPAPLTQRVPPCPAPCGSVGAVLRGCAGS